MHTRLVIGVAPSDQDQKILTMLRFAASKESDEKPMYRAGIRNAEGQVYRIVEAQSLEEASRLVKALENMGLAEEDGPPAEHFVSTFSGLSA